MRRAAACCVLRTSLVLMAMPLFAQQGARQEPVPVDSDHDGLTDTLEQRLLEQFEPQFMVGAHDCSVRPAAFTPGVRIPEVEAENGTIYGQAFPYKGVGNHVQTVELHFYHLWRTDCGRHGHPLDAEHVAVLVQAPEGQPATAGWKALYWYAAAHENTVCDVSQIARASTLHAEEHGATVWISPDKHASYLNETLCQRGCGADRCEAMVPLKPAALIDLGEPSAAMNGSVFADAPTWPLREKMTVSNFPQAATTRLMSLPQNDIAWFNPGRHPAQGVIAHSSATEAVLAQSGTNTMVAMTVAADSSGSALGRAEGDTGAALAHSGDSTGQALGKSYSHTRRALGSSVKHVGKALHLGTAKAEPQPNER